MIDKSKDYEKSTPRVYIRTFGCQMNKLDSELLLGLLSEHGFRIVQSPSEADIVLINSCSVRRHAEERALSILGKFLVAKERKKNNIVGIIGCMAGREGASLLHKFPQLDLVCGPQNYADFIALVQEALGGNVPVMPRQIYRADFSGPRIASCRPSPFQAYVRISEGCDNRCSYCVVPSARGDQICRPPDEIIAEVKELTSQGCREITLLGQSVGNYRVPSNSRQKFTFPNLLEKLSEISAIKRIRFVSAHPSSITPQLYQMMSKLPVVCPHLHMPAQSGSNRILKLMNRPYTVEEYIEKINTGKDLIPQLTFTSDFIVGFPTETEKDFSDTVKLMKEVQFLNSFIFKYSPRPGTEAEKLPDDVPIHVKKERNQALLKFQSEISRKLNQQMIGKQVEVLVEGVTKTNPSRLTGRTIWNHIVVFSGEKDNIGQIVSVKIQRATALTLFG